MKELDALLEGQTNPEQREAIIKAFGALARGNPASMPVQLALITLAQWRAATENITVGQRAITALTIASKEWKATHQELKAQTSALKEGIFAVTLKIEDQIERLLTGLENAANGIDVTSLTAALRTTLDSQISEIIAATELSKQITEEMKARIEGYERAEAAFRWHTFLYPVLLAGVILLVGWSWIRNQEHARAETQIATIATRLKTDAEIASALEEQGISISLDNYRSRSGKICRALLFRGTKTGPLLEQDGTVWVPIEN